MVKLSVREALVAIGECPRDEEPDPAAAKRLKRALRREGALHGGGGPGWPCWTTVHELARLGLIPPDQADQPLHEGVRELLRRTAELEERVDSLQCDVRVFSEVAGEARESTMKLERRVSGKRPLADG
ncbi:MAG: hypothetical protein GVY18_07665 [Bacteroidetes bacterium]|nr:hypothetical protein [Bacteroidota bacterium]